MAISNIFLKHNEWIKAIALENEMPAEMLDSFVRFMEMRFPDERLKSYVEEWVLRFLSGQPEKFCDHVSLKALQIATKEAVQ